jgi:hypothetical protein
MVDDVDVAGDVAVLFVDSEEEIQLDFSLCYLQHDVHSFQVVSIQWMTMRTITKRMRRTMMMTHILLVLALDGLVVDVEQHSW